MHSPSCLSCCHRSMSPSSRSQFLTILPLSRYLFLRKLAPLRAPRRTHNFDSCSGPSIFSSMASPAQGGQSETRPFSVLFVCLGNICRSPAAEGVFRDIVRKRGVDSKFQIDSAGTIGYHEVIIEVQVDAFACESYNSVDA